MPGTPGAIGRLLVPNLKLHSDPQIRPKAMDAYVEHQVRPVVGLVRKTVPFTLKATSWSVGHPFPRWGTPAAAH